MTDLTPHEDTAPGEGHRRRLAIGIGALVAVVALATALYLLTRDDGNSPQTAATSTTAPTTGVATTLPVDTATAVWPCTSSATRYSDPVSAARGFATDDVGFTNPVVGAFRPGDSRSGEVPVQAVATGSVTTVLVRQLGDSWWVLGASTPNIQLSSPGALTAISSPVRLRGSSTAFEAIVNAQVSQDAGTEPLGTGTVMGGANGQMGPFDGTLAFSRPSTASGAVTLLTRSAKDGSVVEATVVRVRFA